MLILSVAWCFGGALAAADAPAWGDLVRSFPTPEVAYPGGVACAFDGYVITGHYGSQFLAWYVYTTGGSFVRSVPVSGSPGDGFRDGSGRCHLGSDYFVGAHGSIGVKAWGYVAGGNPSYFGTIIIPTAQGRGVAWDGVYYYATAGDYGTPVGVYTTGGSLVGTVPGSLSACGLYGHAVPCPANGYIYAAMQTPTGVGEWAASTGLLIRSFAAPSAAAGVDFGWSDGYVYTAIQANVGAVRVYDGPGINGVKPESLGRIKAIYR